MAQPEETNLVGSKVHCTDRLHELGIRAENSQGHQRRSAWNTRKATKRASDMRALVATIISIGRDVHLYFTNVRSLNEHEV